MGVTKPNYYRQLPVVIVDDEPQALSLLQSILTHEGFRNVQAFSDSEEALQYIEKQDVAAVVLDLQMPKHSGMYMLDLVSKIQNGPAVIIVTAENQIDIAIECIKNGAVDYLTKPISVSRFVTSINRALEVRELSGEFDVLKAPTHTDNIITLPGVDFIVTANSQIKVLLQYVDIVARSHQPLLITGETGVGKELFARAFHLLSKRNGPFVSINIAGLDDTIFSDTLFGHKKGAYTGASHDRDGLIKKAANGTLFLDEIGDLNDYSQIKLLRLLQENEYFPLGSDIQLQSHARLVVATNRNLKQLMTEGRFRKDLYYRLCTHQITIPPLRNRSDDIPVLLDHFIRETAKAMGKEVPTYRKELIQLLSAYDFPGNIRELQAMVCDAVTKCSSARLPIELFKEIISRERDSDGSGVIQGVDFNGVTFTSFPTLKQADSELIRKALEIARGNQKIAAQLLGVTRQALNNRLRRGNEFAQGQQ